MSRKREDRKQRQEERRAEQERQARQRKIRSRAILAVGAAALIGVSALLLMRDDSGAEPGRVWSAEHGHWHD
jgi:hypothetical protein